MRKITTMLAAAVLTAAGVAAPVTANAAQPYLHKATGGVYVQTTYAQFMDFSAFDYGDGVVKGDVQYTNFDYPEPGSGVWAFAPAAMTVYITDQAALDPNAVVATHTWTITSVVPTSVDSFAFTATGTGGASPEVVSGTVDGTGISFSSLYVGGSLPGYVWTSTTGAIQSNGKVAGTASSTLGESLGWYTNVGAAREVYNYAAKVTSAVFTGGQVVFGYTIPLTETINSGLAIFVTAADGAWATPAVVDTFSASAGAPSAALPIAGGNVVMHK
jgi:hypothetical protein